jgi:hypothetical protein
MDMSGSAAAHRAVSTLVEVTVGIVTCSSGSSSYFGKVIANGIKLGLSDFDVRRSGCLIRTEQCDDEGDQKKALSAVSLLVDRGAAVIIGPCESHTTATAIEFAAKANIPVISPSATASFLTEQNNPWFFRATPSDAQKAERLARLIALRHPHGPIIVLYESEVPNMGEHDSTLCGDSLARDMRRYLSAFGQVYTLVPYNRNLEDAQLKTSIIQGLHGRAFVGLVILGRSSDTLRISQVVRNLYGECPIYLISPGKEMFSQALLENVYAVTDTIVETVSDDAIERFRARYSNEYPGTARREAIDQYATFGYDTANIVGNAVILAASRGLSNVVSEQRLAIRKAIAETPNERRGLMSDGGFTKQNELLSRPHVQRLSSRGWEQLSFDDAIKSEMYEATGRWIAIHKIYKAAKYNLDSAEKNFAVRILNLIGYIATGVLALIGIYHFLF